VAEKRRIYKIQFLTQGQVYELYATAVSHGSLFGFVEIEEILFGEKSQVVVDPSEERLKQEFLGVKRTFVPMHSVLRIDEVEKEGPGRIRDQSSKEGSVSQFPMPIYTPSNEG
jgi:hypothetical protein